MAQGKPSAQKRTDNSGAKSKSAAKLATGYDQFFQKAREQAPPGRPLKLKQTPHDQIEGRMRALRASPEKALQAAMNKRIQAKKNAKRVKAKFPLIPALFLGVIIAAGATYVIAPQSLTFITDHVDVSFLGSAEAASEKSDKAADKSAIAKTPATATAKTDAPAGEKSATNASPAAEKSAAASTDGASPVAKGKDEKITDTRGWTTEELSFFNKLNERKIELDQRDAELVKLEGELQQQKTELDQKIQQLAKMRNEISGTLKSRVTLDQEKVDKLVQVYSGMKAPQAAKIIESINEDLAVEILDKMKKKSAAEVLNVMEAKKAEKLSEMLAGYNRSPASTAASAPTAPSEVEKPNE